MNATQNNTVCQSCHGVGFVYVDVPVGHRLFGKAIPCKCTLEKRRKRAIQKLCEMIGLSEAEIRRWTFDTFDPNKVIVPNGANRAEIVRAVSGIKRQCIEYAKNPKGWLILSGNYGTGKTHLAMAILNFCMMHGMAVFKASVPEMLDLLRPHKDENGVQVDTSEVMKNMQEAELLVLDDIGTENNTGWVEERLFVLLNRRYSQELPTVFTTNLNILSPDCKIPPRIRSRMTDGINTEGGFCKLLPMPCGDYRGRSR